MNDTLSKLLVMNALTYLSEIEIIDIYHTESGKTLVRLINGDEFLIGNTGITSLSEKQSTLH